MLSISALNIYPIKSVGGISVSDAILTDRGLENDRRWMLVDKENRFLSQREHPVMSSLQVRLNEDSLTVFVRTAPRESITVPLKPAPYKKKVLARIWNDECILQKVSAEADDWFSGI